MFYNNYYRTGLNVVTLYNLNGHGGLRTSVNLYF